MTTSVQDDGSAAVRARIIAAATTLLAEGGSEALTTRAVAAAARVQAPTIYRLFGDKRGLLDAAAEQVLAAYVASKAKSPTHADPLEDFRAGWDLHIAFGLENPALFAIIHGEPRPGHTSPAARAGLEVLRRRIRRLAAAGLLRLGEKRAVALVHAVGTGTVLTLLATPAKQRDPGLATTAREAVIAAVTTTQPAAASNVRVAAITLGAALGHIDTLTPGESQLLAELLTRIAAAG